MSDDLEGEVLTTSTAGGVTFRLEGSSTAWYWTTETVDVSRWA